MAELWPGAQEPQRFDLAEVGVRLQGPSGGAMACQIELRGVLADHVALAAASAFKGHSGTKLCHLCQNVVEAETAGDSRGWLALPSAARSPLPFESPLLPPSHCACHGVATPLG